MATKKKTTANPTKPKAAAVAKPKTAAAKPKEAPKPAPAPAKAQTAKGTLTFAVTDGAVQTVTVTITPKHGDEEKVVKELQHGDSLADYRIVVALVGGSHTGVISPEFVIAETPGAAFV